MKGRGEFHLRFDSLTLPNGTTRDFRAHVTGLDGRASEELDHKEGTIRSEGNKAGDVRTVGETRRRGQHRRAGRQRQRRCRHGCGHWRGRGSRRGTGRGVVHRGPEAVLAKGTTIEMILDRQVQFDEGELDFSNSLPRRSAASDAGGPLPSRKGQQSYPGRIPRF